MHNDFIVVGPGEDPAKIKGTKSTLDSFKKIAASGALFLSRADKSGTHSKEMESGKRPNESRRPEVVSADRSRNGANLECHLGEKRGTPWRTGETYLALKKNLALDILGGRGCQSCSMSTMSLKSTGQIPQSECRRRQGLCRLHACRKKSRTS